MINESYYRQTIVAERILSLEEELRYFKSKMSSVPMPLTQMAKIIEEIECIESLLQQNYCMIFSLCQENQVH